MMLLYFAFAQSAEHMRMRLSHVLNKLTYLLIGLRRWYS